MLRGGGIFSRNKPDYGRAAPPLFCALGFIGALFAENIAIYNVLLGAFVVIYTHIRFKKVYVAQISYLVSAFLGACVILINPSVLGAFSSSDGYRKIASSVSGLFGNILTIEKAGFIENTVLNIFICAVCIAVSCSLFKSMKKRAKWLCYAANATIIVFTLFSILFKIRKYTGFVPLDFIFIKAEVITAIFALYIAALFAFLCILPIDCVKRTKLLFLFFSAGAVVAPLLVAEPIGARCMICSYFFQLCFAGELAILVPTCDRFTKRFSVVCTCAAVCAFAVLLVVYSDIWAANERRVEKAAADIAAGQTVIEVETLPHIDIFTHFGEPIDGEEHELTLAHSFLRYYGLDVEVRVVNVTDGEVNTELMNE